MSDFDVIVLGGGSAGTSAAKAASLAGARTAMINDGELGGLCILRGCMPTKALLASAHAIHSAESLDPLGARLEGRAVPDFRRIMARKDQIVQRFKRAKIESIEASEYEVISGRGRFVEGPALAVEGRRLVARAYVIATGSAPTILPIPGIDDVPVLTSDDVMRLTERPRSVIVQGAGPIGLELGQFFARIGSEVLLVNRSPLLAHYDTEAGEELHRALEAEPRFELLAPSAIQELRRDADGIVATIRTTDDVREHRADALIMAVGRHALLDDIGLEHLAIPPFDGRIQHDEQMQTCNPHVYVAGDSTGAHQVLHLSNQEGEIAGHNAAGGSPRRKIDYRLEMQVVFTDPPYASVGKTFSELKQAGIDVVVSRAHFARTGRAITMGATHGLWRLYTERTTGEILGASILGPRADDLIHEIALMMHYGGKISDVAELPWYHPTLSEVMLDLARDAARQAGAD